MCVKRSGLGIWEFWKIFTGVEAIKMVKIQREGQGQGINLGKSL